MCIVFVHWIFYAVDIKTSLYPYVYDYILSHSVHFIFLRIIYCNLIHVMLIHVYAFINKFIQSIFMWVFSFSFFCKVIKEFKLRWWKEIIQKRIFQGWIPCFEVSNEVFYFMWASFLGF